MSGTSIDYAAALRECGFDATGVARGLRMLESREIPTDFETAVSMLRIEGHQAHVREHQLEPIVQRVAAAEARAAIVARGERAQLRVAAANADREAREAEQLRLSRAQGDALSWLLENMTEAEFEERVPFRQHIADGWRQFFQLKAEEQQRNGEQVSPDVEEALQALDAASRLRLTRSANSSATSTRLEESSRSAAQLGLTGEAKRIFEHWTSAGYAWEEALALVERAGVGVVVERTDQGTAVTSYVPVDGPSPRVVPVQESQDALAEAFQESFGLSEEAAKRAAEGR